MHRASPQVFVGLVLGLSVGVVAFVAAIYLTRALADHQLSLFEKRLVQIVQHWYFPLYTVIPLVVAVALPLGALVGYLWPALARPASVTAPIPAIAYFVAKSDGDLSVVFPSIALGIGLYVFLQTFAKLRERHAAQSDA